MKTITRRVIFDAQRMADALESKAIEEGDNSIFTMNAIAFYRLKATIERQDDPNGSYDLFTKRAGSPAGAGDGQEFLMGDDHLGDDGTPAADQDERVEPAPGTVADGPKFYLSGDPGIQQHGPGRRAYSQGASRRRVAA